MVDSDACGLRDGLSKLVRYQKCLNVLRQLSIMICQVILRGLFSFLSKFSRVSPLRMLQTRWVAQATILSCQRSILCCSRRYTAAKYSWQPSSLESSCCSFYQMLQEKDSSLYSRHRFVIRSAAIQRYRSITQKMNSGSSWQVQSRERWKVSSSRQKVVLLTLNLLYLRKAMSICTARCRWGCLQTSQEMSILMKRWLYLLCQRAMPQRISRRRLGSRPQQKQTCEPCSNWSLEPHTIRNSSNLSLGQLPSKQLQSGSTYSSSFLPCFSFHALRCLSPQLQRLDPSWQQNCFTSFRYFTSFGCTRLILYSDSSSSSTFMAAYIQAQTCSRKGRLTSSLKLMKDMMQEWCELYQAETLGRVFSWGRFSSRSSKSSSSQLTSEASYEPQLVSASSSQAGVSSLGYEISQ